MRRPPIIAVLAGLVVTCASLPSSADIVVFSYSGVVDSLDFPESPMFDGTVTYDTDLGADAFPVDFGIGVYNDSITAFSISIGGTDYSFVANLLDEATVKDDFPDGDGGGTVDGLEFLFEGTGSVLSFMLGDEGATVFTDDSLPVELPALSEFEFQSFDFAFLGAEGSVAGSGDITSIGITVETVPAPSAALLGGLGLATVATLRRRLP